MIFKRLRKVSFYFLTTLFLGSCIAPVGLKRTPFKNWKKNEFKTLGFEIELPTKSFNIFNRYYLVVYDTSKEGSNIDYNELQIFIHPAYSGNHFSEPLYLIQMEIIRMPEESFELFKQGKHRKNSFWMTDSTEFQPDIIRRKEKVPLDHAQGQYLCFRRDLKLPNGDVIVSIARLLTNYEGYTSENLDEDTIAIERILNSVRPIE